MRSELWEFWGMFLGVSFEWYRGMTNTKKISAAACLNNLEIHTNSHMISCQVIQSDPLVEGHLAFERVT